MVKNYRVFSPKMAYCQTENGILPFYVDTLYTSNHISLDVVWTDVEYMDMYKDFTISNTSFNGLVEAVKEWRERIK